ncbi:Wee1-like protein kinase (Wee1A kinase) [Durusdinium trenchii]|uniref:Wee1-like protein kinase (Wee1A kinase) n=1 Tax=Durusdinium trenchii TaxID=1381693 RepID=A0ABP0KRT4_9DINO
MKDKTGPGEGSTATTVAASTPLIMPTPHARRTFGRRGDLVNSGVGSRLQFDSPVRSRESPAMKRRKMYTPRRSNSCGSRSEELLEDDGSGDRGRGVRRPEAKPGRAPHSSKKILFETPDRKENHWHQNVLLNTSFSSSPGGESVKGVNQSNVNPFCSLNESSYMTYNDTSTCASGRKDSSVEYSPEPSMLFASPSTHRRGDGPRQARSRLRPDAETAGSLSLFEASPVPMVHTTCKKSKLPGEERFRKIRERSSSRDSDSSSRLHAMGDDEDSIVGGVDDAVSPMLSSLGPRRRGDSESSDPNVVGDRTGTPPPSALGPGTPRVESPDQRLSPSELCNQMKRTCSVSGSSKAMSSPESALSCGDDGLIDEEDEVASSLPARVRHNQTFHGGSAASPGSPLWPRRGKATSAARHMLGRSSRAARGGPESPDSEFLQTERRRRGHVHHQASRPVAKPSRFKEEFEEQGILGGGTFGTVYKCKNRLDGCMYAVKVTKQRFKGRADRERVLKEVYALSALCNAEDNPHIVRYFSAFVEDGRLYIQTELCDMSLQDMIRKGHYPRGIESVAKDLARQVLEGLSRLHKHNLVHLDIKPANIFVKNGVFKVGDLGHACLARIQTGGDAAAAPSAAAGAASSSSSSSSSASLKTGGHPSDHRLAVSTPMAVRGLTSSLLVDSPSSSGRKGSPMTIRGDGVLPAPPPIDSNDMTPVKSRRAGVTHRRSSLSRQQNTVSASPDLLVFDSGVKAKAGNERSFAADVEEGDSRYMALEILQEDFQHLTKGDIFSLGASIYEMCLGRELPANGEEWQEIREGVLNDYALARFSEPLRQLVRLMLAKDPVARPSAASLLASGGPGGILRSEWEAKLAREKAAADEYRKQLARMHTNAAAHHPPGPSASSSAAVGFDADGPYRMRRSNTM